MNVSNLSTLHIYRALKQQRREADQAYYFTDTSIMTDEEYDALVMRIKEEAPLYGESEEDSSVMTIKRTGMAEHPSRMWSIDTVVLEDSYRLDDLLEKGICVEPKLDGIAVNLIYDDGVLVEALSRGDYFKGESVLPAVFHTDNIPKRIAAKGRVEVRGEMMMLKSDFQRANAFRLANHQETLSNPRNAVAGTLRAHWANGETLFTERKLTFYAYAVGLCEETFKTRKDLYNWLELQNFDVAVIEKQRVTKKEILKSLFYTVKEDRGDYDFDMDGIVVKVFDIDQERVLGNGRKAPKWAYAVKFNESKGITKVTQVFFTVGRTGRLTPVVEYEPIELAGATCRYATIHSIPRYEELGIVVGDDIEVIRSGDTIPYIFRSLTPKPVEIPLHCPYCYSSLKIKGVETVYCPNHMGCSAQFKNILKHQVSRSVFDIKGLSEKTIEAIVGTGEISTVIEFWTLPDTKTKWDNVARCLKWTPKQQHRIKQGLLSIRKECTLEQALKAASVPGWGSVVCETQAQSKQTLHEFLKSVYDGSLKTELSARLWESLNESSAHIEFLVWLNTQNKRINGKIKKQQENSK